MIKGIEISFLRTSKCWLCDEIIRASDKTVRDHCHLKRKECVAAHQLGDPIF